MATNYKVIGTWAQTETGEVYIAKAISSEGRELAKVSCDVPLEVGLDFVSYYGSATLKQTVVSTTQDFVKVIADAAPDK